MPNAKEIGSIELETFEYHDIFEFASKNNLRASTDDISRILNFSRGLPIFVSLFMMNQNNKQNFIPISYDRIEEYLNRIIEDLDPKDNVLAQYIGFMSVTNAIIPINELKKNNCEFEMSNLKALENSALIEIDQGNYTVKMHELIRNHICKRHLEHTDIIENIYRYYEQQKMDFELAYYLIMLDISDREKSIVEAIKKGIRDEKFSFLIMFGEHCKQLYGCNYFAMNLHSETFLYITYGYVEGHIGVGNYPAAREIIDKCKISARMPESEIQFKFSMTTAQLYHLQNNYDESIVTYETLLDHIKKNTWFKEYEPKCFWGIAHSLRHQGYDLDNAVKYYEKAISSAKLLGNESEIIKSMREKLLIYMLRGNRESAKQLYSDIKNLIEKLPENSYLLTRISFLKSEVVYQRTVIRDNPKYEYDLLKKVLGKYEENQKRLQYNIYFEFGEYYRRVGKYSLSEENYRKALVFSQKNKDHNLETLSQIAIIVNDICCGHNKENICIRHKTDAIRCFDDSVKYDLYTNKLLADIIISYLTDSGIDVETCREFERLGYASAVNLCKSFEHKRFKELDLFLM
jgi:tetratricopeptide (TPR) repeat protein